MDEVYYWRDRYGFPRDSGTIEFGRFLHSITFMHETADRNTREKQLDWMIKAILDREGNPRWYTLLDERGQVLRRFPASTFIGPDVRGAFEKIINEIDELYFGSYPGWYLPEVPVARWLRSNVNSRAAEVFCAAHVPGSWHIRKYGDYPFSPGKSPAEKALNALIHDVRIWALDCRYPETGKYRRNADHASAWVVRRAPDLPLSIGLAARDVETLWGEAIDAREIEHVYDSGEDGDYWLVRGVFVTMQESSSRNESKTCIAWICGSHESSRCEFPPRLRLRCFMQCGR
jgi:hypothetical protein